MIVPGIRFVQGVNDYDDRDGTKYGIGIHNTSNDASDEGEASYGTWRTDGTSAHLYCDDDSVTQSLDTGDKAGHAGSAAGNENAIAVEITGANGKTRAWWLANVAWDKLGRVLATVIRHHWPDWSFQVRRASVAEMKANPKVKAFYGHDDMRLAWGGTTHTDPGPNFPWDRLFAAVNAALEAGDDMALTDKLNDNSGEYQGWTLNNTMVTLLKRTGYLANQLGLEAKLGKILEESVDDGTTTVQMSAEDRAALAAQLAEALHVPTAEEIATSVADEDHRRSEN